MSFIHPLFALIAGKRAKGVPKTACRENRYHAFYVPERLVCIEHHQWEVYADPLPESLNC